MPYLHCDVETRSAIPIADCGSHRYINDTSFSLLLLSYAIDDGDVKLVDFTRDGDDTEFRELLCDPAYVKVAWNASFERGVFTHVYGDCAPPEQWRDAMVLAASCGLPLSLGQCSAALCLPQDAAKDKAGRDLIRRFCVPKKDGSFNDPAADPERWTQFCEYNRQDVVAERTIFHMLEEWLPDGTEHRLWCLDARINEKGVRVDRTLAAHAAEMDERFKAELTEKAIALTGLDNPGSVTQVKRWLREQEGLEVMSLNKKAVADVVAQLQTEEAKKFMAIRSMLAKTSASKYDAMLRCSTDADPHVHGTMQFFGAHTGRWAGRLLQVQNLPQNHLPDLAEARELVRAGDYETLKCLYDNVPGVLSELIRTGIVPEPGCRLVVADFSAIEARVTAWLAGEEWRMEVFRNGGDIYCASASQMFHVPVVKHGENGDLRQKGKIAELALGYGGGVGALKAFGGDKPWKGMNGTMHPGMTEEEMGEIVGRWRESSPKVVALWKKLERAASLCASRHTAADTGVHGIRYEWERGIMWLRLPSGRRMAYFNAEYRDFPRRVGSGKCLTYMVLNQTTRKWERVETFGGRLVENCFAAGTLVLTRDGWKPIERIHGDELVWDGEAFVETAGSVFTGRRETIALDGVRVTPDHKILTKEGWRCAETCNGLDRLRVQLPTDHWPGRDADGRRPEKVEGPLSGLRFNSRNRPARSAEEREDRRGCFVRLLDEAVSVRGEYDTWDVKTSGLRGLALHDTALHRAYASVVEELRRAWHHRVRPLAAQLRELLGGHGADIPEGTRPRPAGQLTGVLSGELPLGYEAGEQREHAGAARGEHSAGPDVRGGAVEAHGDWEDHADLPAESRLPDRYVVDATRHTEPVFDLLNCGPRHRFVVLGSAGPMIVHNCVQAVARDCLREAMLNLEHDGWDMRFTVHDEIVCSEPEHSGRGWERMAAQMAMPIDWAPGLLLRADGYECEFYQKD